MRIELNSLNHAKFCWFHCHSQSHFRPSRKCSVSNLSVLARAKRKREKSLGEVVGIWWRSWPAKGDKNTNQSHHLQRLLHLQSVARFFSSFFLLFCYQCCTICASHRTRNLTIQSPSTSAFAHIHTPPRIYFILFEFASWRRRRLAIIWTRKDERVRGRRDAISWRDTWATSKFLLLCYYKNSLERIVRTMAHPVGGTLVGEVFVDGTWEISITACFGSCLKLDLV